MQKLENKDKILGLICLVSTIIIAFSSSLYTWQLFKTLGKGYYSFVMGLLGLAFDSGKYAFAALAGKQYKKNDLLGAIIAGLIAIFCVAVSFGASQTFDLNRANEIKQEAIRTSNKGINLTVDRQKKELGVLIAEKNKEVLKASESLRKELDNLPQNYITMRQELSNQITEIETKTRSQIDNRIKTLEKNIKENEKKADNAEVTTTKGVFALAKWINPSNPEKTLGTIVLVKNIFAEFLGIAFSIGAGVFLGNETINIKNKLFNRFKKEKNGTQKKENFEVLKGGNENHYSTMKTSGVEGDLLDSYSIDAKTYSIVENKQDKGDFEKDYSIENESYSTEEEKTKFTLNDVFKYIDFMYENSKDKKSIGQDKIKNGTNLNVTQVRGIHFYLCKRGVLKVENKQTFILVEKEKAIEILSKIELAI